jgi:hypothetical protein
MINKFIKKSSIKHNYKYNYDDVIYIDNRTKVIIKCPTHGDFSQTPEKHLMGHGCPKCSKNNKKTTEEYIKQCKTIHGDKYDYDDVIYNGAKKYIIIICKKHGKFKQIAYHHLNGCGCPKCANKNKDVSTIIQTCNDIHNNKYDYSKMKYINNRLKVKIICPIHGTFEQNLSNHIDKKQGCPYCNESHGEKFINHQLKIHNINFIRQFKFNNCKNIRNLTFDFYLPDINTCIEFNGIQHYETVKYFGGLFKLKYIQHNDEIKESFCKQNNIKLIKIKYDENILEKLNDLWNTT